MWIGCAVTVIGASLRRPDPRSPIVLPPATTDDKSITLYPHSGVTILATDNSTAVTYYNSTGDEIHYVELEDGKFRFMRSEKTK